MSRHTPAAARSAAGALALVLLALGGCDRGDPPPQPVTRLDDPQLAHFPSATGATDLEIEPTDAQRARWSSQVDGELDLVAVARYGADVGVLHVRHSRQAGDLRAGLATFAVDCPGRQMRLLGTQGDGIGLDVPEGIAPWPAAGPLPEMFGMFCAHRFECEQGPHDLPCPGPAADAGRAS